MISYNNNCFQKLLRYVGGVGGGERKGDFQGKRNCCEKSGVQLQCSLKGNSFRLEPSES